MGFRLEAVKAAIRGKPGGLGAFFAPRVPLPPARDTREWLELYGKSPRMSPVNKIATDLSVVPGKLRRIGEDGDAEEIKKHPFLAFWENPNPIPELSAAALWRLMEIWLLIKGEAFAVIERDRRGFPAELWPIPPHWAMQTPSVDRPFYVIRSRDGTNRMVPMADMFVMREPHPLDPYGRGLGMTEMLADEIETDEYMSRHAMAYFYNNASSGVILSAPGMNEDQRKRFREEWQRQYRGVHNAHKTAIVNGELTAVKLSDTQKEMDFAASRKDLRDAITQHYGIPPEILGIVENSNRATATQAKIIYAENVLSPRLLARQVAVNQQLVAVWGEEYEWRYDDIVPEDQEFKLQMAGEGLAKGALTLNEWRELNGMDPVDGGDVITPPYSALIMRPEDLLTQGARQNAGPGTADNAEPQPSPYDVWPEAAPVVPSNDPGLDPQAEQVRVASEVSLNGAQITSLLAIVTQVHQRVLPRDSAIEIITAAFPFDRRRAEEILGDETPLAPPEVSHGGLEA